MSIIVHNGEIYCLERRYKANKETYPCGHPSDKGNTLIYYHHRPDHEPDGPVIRKRCAICKRASDAEYRKRKRKAKEPPLLDAILRKIPVSTLDTMA